MEVKLSREYLPVLKEQANLAATEIVEPQNGNFLREFVKSKRNIIKAVDVLDREPQLRWDFEQYEKDLEQFLATAEVATLGNEINFAQAKIATLSLERDSEVRLAGGRINNLSKQREQLKLDRRDLEIRIVGIGKEKFIGKGDVKLLWGRMKVTMWKLQEAGRLSGFGQITALAFGVSRVHPRLALYDHSLISNKSEINSLSALQNNLLQGKDDYFEKQIYEGAHLAALTENLFQHLDDWALKRWNRLLVHLSLHPDRQFSIIQTYKIKFPKDWQRLLNKLSRLELLPADFERFLKAEVKELAKILERSPEVGKQVRELPVKLKINGEVYSDIEKAREAFSKLTGKNMSNKKERQIFNRIIQVGYSLSLGDHPADLKKLNGQEIVKRLGGEWRFRVGRSRAIVNFDTREDEQIMELVSVLSRDHHLYY